MAVGLGGVAEHPVHHLLGLQVPEGPGRVDGTTRRQRQPQLQQQSQSRLNTYNQEREQKFVDLYTKMRGSQLDDEETARRELLERSRRVK